MSWCSPVRQRSERLPQETQQACMVVAGTHRADWAMGRGRCGCLLLWLGLSWRICRVRHVPVLIGYHGFSFWHGMILLPIILLPCRHNPDESGVL